MAGLDDIDYSNFFDHIDDLLNIPDEACATDNSNAETDSDFFFGDYFKDFPSIMTQFDGFTEPTKSVFSEHRCNSAPVPYEDIEQLEWLSNFVEDSFSSGNSLTIDVPNSVPSSVVSLSPSPTQFQTTSPVSVLESSSSSYSGGKFMPVTQTAAAGKVSGRRCGRARSESPRPLTFNRRVSSPSASFTMPGSGCGSYGSKIRKSDSNADHNKKKMVKMSVATNADQNDEVRKCQHCEITKTPQWRAGPNGPKTLCNACGVRYKSGRLFPEYRPAASPTFVPTIHSNSHKKVLEMRVKTTTSDLVECPLTEDSCTE